MKSIFVQNENGRSILKAAGGRDLFSSLKHKNFRYFWFGQCISLIGTWMQRTAQIWLVYQMTNSPLLLGVLGVFQFVPVMALSLFAGVIVDRYPKKKLLYLTQTIFMLQAVIMTVLVWSGRIQYWHILVLSLVFGCSQAIDMPARQSFFIDLVGREDLMNAISLNSSIVNLAKVLGPAVAGAVMVKMGATFCFFINTLSFIAVLWGLFLIKVEYTPIKKEKVNMLKNIKDGLIYIKKDRTLYTTALIMAIVCTFAMNTDVIIPVFAKTVLGKDAAAYSVLLSAVGLGSLFGAIFMAWRSKKGISMAMLFADAVLVSIAHILAAFTGNYYVSMICLILVGFFILSFLNMGNSTLQINSSDEYRGRVMSVYTLLNAGSTPIGNAFAGAVMERMGGSMGFFMCGIATLVPSIILLIFIRSRKVKKAAV
jgi:Arabinose efflux permease